MMKTVMDMPLLKSWLAMEISSISEKFLAWDDAKAYTIFLARGPISLQVFLRNLFQRMEHSKAFV
jgi:hypothetical protein